MVVQYIENKKKKNLFEYDILGSVFSGDCDTTLCNTIRMAMYNIYVNERAGLKYGKDFVAISKGDDFTVFYKNYVSNKLIENAYDRFFLRSSTITGEQQIYGLGQILKFLTIGDPSTISFCSLKALYTDISEAKIILVRDFTKFNHLSRYSRKIKALHGKQRIAYLQQQAISLRATYPGINIFETMAQAFDHAAQQYALYLSKNDEVLANKICNDSLKYVDKIIKFAREQIPEDGYTEENEITEKLYSIGKMKHFYKIQENYWETMKRLQEKCSYNLTQSELQYINEQIDAIMSLHIFKADMGLKI
jgi:hypothetical protein